MTGIFLNNRFAKSFQTASNATLKTWTRFSDYRTRFSALSAYSQGLITNAFYSKTTAAALVVMAAGAGIALWNRYQSHNKINKPVNKEPYSIIPRKEVVFRPRTVNSGSEVTFKIPDPLPKEGNKDAFQPYLTGLIQAGTLQGMFATMLPDSLEKSEPTFFVVKVQAALNCGAITPEIRDEILQRYFQEKIIRAKQ